MAQKFSPPLRLPVVAASHRKVENRSGRHDARWIDVLVAFVIVMADMVEVDCLSHPIEIIDVAGEAPERRIVDDTADVAFEVTVIHRVESDERREQANIGFGEFFAKEIA